MEANERSKTIPLDYIRGLIVAQGGRCAITGVPLNPVEVNADHIIPLSREELSPSSGKDNIWLVHKKINAMKGAMTYAEFLEACQSVLDHHAATRALLERIRKDEVAPRSKNEFDLWVEKNCEKDGRLKSEQSAPGDA